MMLLRVFADAAALWRRDRDLWLRVAGFCFFVPAFAMTLFLQTPDLRGLAQDAANKAVLGWFGANAPWLIGLAVWQVYSAGVALVLVLDPARPSLAAALVRALRMLPGLSLAYFCMAVLVGAGASFFIVPGLYVMGRTFMTLPILVAEPERGPFGALFAAVQRSHRRGWMLFFVPISALFVQLMGGSIVETFGAALGGDAIGPVHFVFAGLEAVVMAAGALAQALLQAATYRELGAVKQGI